MEPRTSLTKIRSAQHHRRTKYYRVLHYLSLGLPPSTCSAGEEIPVTRDELAAMLAEVNEWGDNGYDRSELFHEKEDILAIAVLKAIADGTVWDPREAARMMADQMESDNTRWYD